ncbi:MAG: hypothetical protein WD294_02300 [Phycisphaeraceae bacterium]
MGDLLQRGTDWLAQQRHEHLTRPVTYRRGDASVEVQATIGRTVFRVDDTYGNVIRHVSRDYLIRAADLVVNDEATVPQRGDRIEEVIGDQLVTHEVMSPDKATGDWRYSDPQRLTLRIHTKQIREEPLP